MMDRDDKILSYLQDRLSPDDRDKFEAEMVHHKGLAAEVDLMRSVRAELARGPKHQNSDEVWNRLSASIDPVAQPANDNRSPMTQILRYAAVAMLAIGAWQLTVVPRLGNTPEDFRTASQPTNMFDLQVKFTETATIGDIGAMLAPFGGTISEGPSALGLVRLSFPDQASLTQAVDILNTRTDLVELVAEP